MLVVDEAYRCIGLVTVKDIEKAVTYPNATKDGAGRDLLEPIDSKGNVLLGDHGNLDAAEGLKGNLKGLEWVQKELRQPGLSGPPPQESAPTTKVQPKPAAPVTPGK